MVFRFFFLCNVAVIVFGCAGGDAPVTITTVASTSGVSNRCGEVSVNDQGEISQANQQGCLSAKGKTSLRTLYQRSHPAEEMPEELPKTSDSLRHAQSTGFTKSYRFVYVFDLIDYDDSFFGYDNKAHFSERTDVQLAQAGGGDVPVVSIVETDPPILLTSKERNGTHGLALLAFFENKPVVLLRHFFESDSRAERIVAARSRFMLKAKLASDLGVGPHLFGQTTSTGCPQVPGLVTEIVRGDFPSVLGQQMQPEALAAIIRMERFLSTVRFRVVNDVQFFSDGKNVKLIDPEQLAKKEELNHALYQPSGVFEMLDPVLSTFKKTPARQKQAIELLQTNYDVALANEIIKLWDSIN